MIDPTRFIKPVKMAEILFPVDVVRQMEVKKNKTTGYTYRLVSYPYKRLFFCIEQTYFDHKDTLLKDLKHDLRYCYGDEETAKITAPILEQYKRLKLEELSDCYLFTEFFSKRPVLALGKEVHIHARSFEDFGKGAKFYFLGEYHAAIEQAKKDLEAGKHRGQKPFDPEGFKKHIGGLHNA